MTSREMHSYYKWYITNFAHGSDLQKEIREDIAVGYDESRMWRNGNKQASQNTQGNEMN
jgi:hypothetical protein